MEDIFERHHARYGYRRINQELRRTGIFASEKRVPHIMRRLGLVAKGATRKHSIQKRVEPGDLRLSLVERVFAVNERNRLWVGYIAYVPTSEGWLYLAGRHLCLAIEISTLGPDWSRHFGSGCRPAFIVVPASASRPFACSHLQIPPGDRGARCDRWPRRPASRLRGSFPTC